MRAIIFGATGMVGQGVLRECLRDPEVTHILLIGRTSSETRDARITDLVRQDLTEFSDIADQLRGYDACFFCLGVTSVGMTEADYRRITYDITLAVGQTLARLNPAMTFIYVSGTGTDSSEKGRVTWARVKGATENALLRLPFAAAYMFRPGFIRPLHGITSKTKLYSVLYRLGAPLYPVLRLFAGKYMTTTEELGRAMLCVAKRGARNAILESGDIAAAARNC